MTNEATELPEHAQELLDLMMIKITDYTQQQHNPLDIVQWVHDVSCFWLINQQLPENVDPKDLN